MSLFLLDHNKATYSRIKAMWKKTIKVAVVQATGTGKSYLIASVLNDFKKERKIIIAPSKYILHQLKDQFGFNDDKTLYYTYSKIHRLTLSEIQALKPQLIVLDEYHRVGADEWGKGVDNILKQYPKAYLFGTTATPIRHLDDARDMSKELFEGNLANDLNLARAIVKGILPSPKYVSALYSLEEIVEDYKTRISNYKKQKINKQKYFHRLEEIKLDFQKSRGIPFILQKHLNSEYKKVIVFCKGYQHLLAMEPVIKQWFEQTNIYKSVNMYRVVTAEPEREKAFREFKEHKQDKSIDLLLSVDMFNEGLHIEGVSGVILLRETKSPNLFYQQIGRCLIVGHENHPVVFDLVNNFKSVHADTFLKDLEYYREEEFNNGYYKESGIEPPAFSIIDETREINEIFGEIKFSLDIWEEKLELLKQFKKEHGHLNIPYSHPELGKYVSKLRKSYAKNLLSKEQVDALNELGFIWRIVDTREMKLQKIIEFKRKHGHLNIPASHPELGDYVTHLRRIYKQNKLDTTTIDTLNDWGFVWVVPMQETINFDTLLIRLKAFKKKHGHLKIPLSDQKLYALATRLRFNYKRNKLGPEKIKSLNDLGFDLRQIDPDASFNEKFEMIVQFRKEHGHLNFSYAWQIENNMKGWINFVRHKKNLLGPEKYKRLLNINFPFEPKKDSWKSFIEALVAYKEKYGNYNVMANQKEDAKLYGQVIKYRTYKHRLSKEHVEQLNSMGFEWKNHTEIAWLKMFDKLVQFEKKFKTTEVPSYKDYERLHGWLRLQKKHKAKNKLEQWKIDKLNSLQTHSWDLKLHAKGEFEAYKNIPDFHQEKGWNEKFERLNEFYKKNGHLGIHFSDRRLYLWKYAQIRRHKQNKLRNDRIDKLKQIGLI